MKELIAIIEAITKYGIQPQVESVDKEKDLEKNLIKLYALSFEVDYEFDETNFNEIYKFGLPDIRENVSSNFQDWGEYHKVRNCAKPMEDPIIAKGDAIHDLTVIISDLLEIKRRKEFNSERDAWWYYELTFYGHTQQHIINLLNFMKSKNG